MLYNREINIPFPVQNLGLSGTWSFQWIERVLLVMEQLDGKISITAVHAVVIHHVKAVVENKPVAYWLALPFAIDAGPMGKHVD